MLSRCLVGLVASSLLWGCSGPLPSCRQTGENVQGPERAAKGQPLTVQLSPPGSFPLVASLKAGDVPGMAVSATSYAGTPTTVGRTTVTFELKSQANDCTPADVNLELNIVEPECAEDVHCRYFLGRACTASSQCPGGTTSEDVCTPTAPGHAICTVRALDSNTCGAGTTYVGLRSVEGTSFDSCVLDAGKTCVSALCTSP